MVDLAHNKCIEQGCTKRPSYNTPGNKTPIYCVEHHTPGEMVDVTHKKCESPGCQTRPMYAIMGTKIARFCGKHKTEDSYDVTHNVCEHEGCPNRAAFDVPGSKVERFCGKHRTPDMDDLRNRQCEEEGCRKQAKFGLPGQFKICCGEHKDRHPGLVELSKKYCEINDCPKTATYGRPGTKVSHCITHRTSGMILRPTAKCSHCKKPALWGVNQVPKHCEKHKAEGDENLVERPCTSCGLLYVLDRNDQCECCNPETFRVARLAKQTALMDYLDAMGLPGTTTDVPVNGTFTCGRERPDRMYDFGDKIVVLECDEHQHRERDCVCEQTRMVNIGQAFGGIPVYFIRWNPDDYLPAVEGHDTELVSKRRQVVGQLIANIQEGRVDLPVALVSVLYMYFNGWSSMANASWIPISEIHRV